MAGLEGQSQTKPLRTNRTRQPNDSTSTRELDQNEALRTHRHRSRPPLRRSRHRWPSSARVYLRGYRTSWPSLIRTALSLAPILIQCDTYTKYRTTTLKVYNKYKTATEYQPTTTTEYSTATDYQTATSIVSVTKIKYETDTGWWTRFARFVAVWFGGAYPCFLAVFSYLSDHGDRESEYREPWLGFLGWRI